MQLKKKVTSWRLTEDAKKLIAKLQEKLGVSATGVVELAVRKLAQLESIKE